MKASYTSAGSNFLPVIIHNDGRREAVFGDPLATRKAARFYAGLHIADRGQAAFRQRAREEYAATRARGI